MKYHIKSASLLVADAEKSRKFYEKVLNVKTIEVDGETVVCLEPGSRLWLRPRKAFMINAGICTDEAPPRALGGAVISLFSENFENFVQRLEKQKVEYVHTVRELPTLQRTIRFYDPDKNIIEVSEDLVETSERLLASGLTAEQVGKKLDLPAVVVTQWHRRNSR